MSAAAAASPFLRKTFRGERNKEGLGCPGVSIMCAADSAPNCTSTAEKLSTLIRHQKTIAGESLDGEADFLVSDTG